MVNGAIATGALSSASSIKSQENTSSNNGSGCCSGRSAEKSPQIHGLHSHEHRHAPPRGPDLPPLLNISLYFPGDAQSSTSSSPPTFPMPDIPPLSEIAQLAGTGCCCGVQCACPGCVQHRGQAHTSPDFKDCKDGCGTCVDNEGGIELPVTSVFGRVQDSSSLSGGAHASGSGSKYLDAFLACAAQLPPPSGVRNAARSFDPMNVTVYPHTLFSTRHDNTHANTEQARAFGLITIPKLQCGCRGRCGCPEGQCACGDACDGCGEGHEGEDVDAAVDGSRSAAGTSTVLFGVSEDELRVAERSDAAMTS